VLKFKNKFGSLRVKGVGKAIPQHKIKNKSNKSDTYRIGVGKGDGRRPLRRKGIHVTILKRILRKPFGTVFTAFF
jgi:hypothetical protein